MRRTQLNAWHAAHGAKLVDFAGWEMPIQYTTITQEHHAVRQSAGLFDIAHMGRLWFSGPDACVWLDYLLTNEVAKLSVGQVRYSLFCNESGGILDDVLVYRQTDNLYLLVVNAGNREKIVNWIQSHQQSFDANMSDRSLDTFMFAVQGPQAEQILSSLVATPLSEMKYYRVIDSSIDGARAVISRTGYTGEDGFEVIVKNSDAERVWQKVFEAGQRNGLLTCGLGCRDTLRLEAAMPLYGHEMDESVDPYTAGLSFGVKEKSAEFLGKQALTAASTRSNSPKRVGLILDSRRIARETAPVCSGETVIGKVTSGTFSPTLEKSIAMAYVPSELASPGTKLEVDIRGKREPATVVPLPFYRRPMRDGRK